VLINTDKSKRMPIRPGHTSQMNLTALDVEDTQDFRRNISILGKFIRIVYRLRARVK
jgi:hypothetical protein